MTAGPAVAVRPAEERLDSASLRVLRDLGVEEVEVEASLLFLGHLVELADRGEVLPVDTRDPAGGFGGVDLLIATIVPALAAARELRRRGTATPAALEAAVDDAIRRVRSPRARRQRRELIATLLARL